ncbi:hypothetical protein IFM89_021438 [Coptis chinensis]|uniref:SOUL heme-binding protein n=1 Tax=Coptis chinensis TaxID=261450 RepID=A0A835MAA0_9MAGN|nr:hypothetical protein IFM89_021438 [Coptis chinensis]
MNSLKISIFFLCFLFVFILSNGIESPQFTVVHTESDFEIRLYRDSAWMSAPVRDISFEKATKLGFHRLYQYIHGANFNSSELVMTSPILTSIMPDAHKLEYYVRFYVSTKFNGTPPSPLSDLNLQFSKWKTLCLAVRKFFGFATDSIVSKEVEALVAGVSRLRTENSKLDKNSYTVAHFTTLFQYIQGANLNNSRVSMTIPVLTSIVADSGPFHSSAYFVRFYLPVKFQGTPPLPLPELNLQPVAWSSHCIAVRKFSGFARDKNVVAEAEKLSLSLSSSPWANSTSKANSAYSIAQYNSPFRFVRRVNEVWVDIDEGCESDGVASY